MIVYTADKTPIQLSDTPFSRGGEGEVFTIINPAEKYRETCAKLLFTKSRTSLREQKISFMVANPPSTLQGNGFILSWPLQMLYDSESKFVGFIMPLAFPDSQKLTYLTISKVSKKLDDEWHKRYNRENGEQASINRLKLMKNIAIPIHHIHKTGKYILKDFKPDNVMVTYDGRVTIVDMDSIQICDNHKMLFPGEAATIEYMPPEFHTSNVGKDTSQPLNQSWDMFAVGTVFYQILFGIHPFVVTPANPRNPDSNEIVDCIIDDLFPFGKNQAKIKTFPQPHLQFNSIPETLKQLFIRTFTSDCSQRPIASEWGKTVHNIISPPEFPTSSQGQKDSTVHATELEEPTQILNYILISLAVVSIIMIFLFIYI